MRQRICQQNLVSGPRGVASGQGGMLSGVNAPYSALIKVLSHSLVTVELFRIYHPGQARGTRSSVEGSSDFLSKTSVRKQELLCLLGH